MSELRETPPPSNARASSSSTDSTRVTPPSPFEIPVRQSSHKHNTSNGSTASSKPTLKPIPEGNWLAQSKPGAEGYRDGVTSNGVDSAAQGETPSQWPSSKEKIILGPYEYMENIPGKDFRKQFIKAFNAWLRVPPQSLEIITRIVRMLHTASLLVDDVEDSSLLRRGVPVAHSIFGTAQTINSANYVYFLALEEVQKLGNPKAIQIYAEELLNLHRGQGMDLFWRDTLTCPSEDDYLEMVGNKTGGLFRLAVKLMQAESSSTRYTPSYHLPSSLALLVMQKKLLLTRWFPQNRDYVPLASLLSLAFQILDDYLNLSSKNYTSNKGLCEDLTEGKFSFPIIHAIRSNPHNLQLINILKQKTQDEEVKRYAVNYMEGCGSFEYTRGFVNSLKQRAEGIIGEFEREEGREGAEALRRILERMDPSM